MEGAWPNETFRYFSYVSYTLRYFLDPMVSFCPAFLLFPGLGNGRCDTKDDGSWSFPGRFLSMAAAFGGRAIGQIMARAARTGSKICQALFFQGHVVLGVSKPMYFTSFLHT